jgi:hypothetical protein
MVAAFFRLIELEVFMSMVSRRCLAGVAVFLVFVTMILPTAAGQAHHSPRPHVQGRLALAADITSKEGTSAKLPPHISTLLGIAKDEECPVMQRVVHAGSLVQGFDVSTKNKNDIVLFVVDEAANDQSLYLTSPAGTLRKMVTVKAGVGDVVRITDKDTLAFKKEMKFWVDRLVPTSTVK